MPYAKTRVVIPLCETCCKGYKPTLKASIHMVFTARECIAHYIDLDTISCLRKRKGEH